MPVKKILRLKRRSRKTTSGNEDDRNILEIFDGQYINIRVARKVKVKTAISIDSQADSVPYTFFSCYKTKLPKSVKYYRGC